MSVSQTPTLARERIGQIAVLLGSLRFVWTETAARAPEGKGAYALVMCLGSPVAVSLGRDSHVLDAGLYVYAGSAYGPGGIGARLRRHFRHEKRVHWHVDRLTIVAKEMHALAFENGSECEIVERLSDSGGFTVPLNGFGSSDCRICRSHLLKWR